MVSHVRKRSVAVLGHRLSITNYVYELIRDGTKRLYVDELMSFLVKKN